jgi:hypothetical protein
MGYQTALVLCWLKRPPIHCIWSNTTNQHLDNPRCKGKIRWCLGNGYAKQQSNCCTITILTWPKIVDAPLTLIFRMGQWLYSVLFCLSRLPIQPLCWKEIQLLNNYHSYKTKNCWRSVDPHFQNGAVTMSLAVLPIKAVSTTVMLDSDEITSQLRYLQDQKSLKLRWHSFYHGCICNMAPLDFA